MPEKQYFKSVAVKSGSTITDLGDVKDSEARADLADLEDYVEGIAPVSLSITENGTYTAPTGVFGYSPVTVSVSPNVNSKTITQNGVYTAALENLDGYSVVVVNIPSGAMIGVIDEEAIVGEGTIEE